VIFFEDVTIRVGHRGRIRGECSTRGHRCTARRVRGAGRLSGSDSSRHDFEDDVVARFNNLFAHTGVELTGAIKILILCTIADIVLHTHVLASFQNGCMLYHTIERCGFEVVTIVLQVRGHGLSLVSFGMESKALQGPCSNPPCLWSASTCWR